MTCVTAEYSINGDYVDVINRGVFWPALPISVNGQAQCWAADGNCQVSFSSNPTFDGTRNYNILETDYDNYAIVYSCRPTWWDSGIQQELWILSRTPVMSNDLLTSIQGKISEWLPEYQSWLYQSLTF